VGWARNQTGEIWNVCGKTFCKIAASIIKVEVVDNIVD
jgi:hypothetical protein